VLGFGGADLWPSAIVEQHATCPGKCCLECWPVDLKAEGRRRLRRGRCAGWLCVLAYEHTLDTPIWNDPHDGGQDID
jgi:hypothetical protein